MADRSIKLVITSSLKNVYLIDMLIETLCSLISMSDDQSFWVKLCVVEAVNNSIIHAYENEPDHEVEVIFSLYPGSMELKVCDTGKRMKNIVPDEASSVSESDSDMENFESRGRGLSIIREMMDKVSYETDNGRNCLTMVKLLKERR